MIPLVTGAALKAAALKTAVALTAATAGATLLTGTAQAATPGPATSTVAAVTQQADLARFDPHRRAFRAHFRTYGQCVFFANHDRNPRTNGWDCRHGGDRNLPWEYWY